MTSAVPEARCVSVLRTSDALVYFTHACANVENPPRPSNIAHAHAPAAPPVALPGAQRPARPPHAWAVRQYSPLDTHTLVLHWWLGVLPQRQERRLLVPVAGGGYRCRHARQAAPPASFAEGTAGRSVRRSRRAVLWLQGRRRRRRRVRCQGVRSAAWGCRQAEGPPRGFALPRPRGSLGRARLHACVRLGRVVLSVTRMKRRQDGQHREVRGAHTVVLAGHRRGRMV